MKIGIVGLGLIGGSLALDFQAQGHSVLGVARRPETAQDALVRGVVQEASTELSILTAAEVIFLCTPIADLRSTVERLIPYIRPSTILTDVGSVKSEVVMAIAPLWRNFVGGHPMAGKSESGLTVAERHLFRQKSYVLTPTADTPPAVVAMVRGLIDELGAIAVQCDPSAHDRAVAWISHLPVMVSAGLINACVHEPDPEILELAQQLASSGFRDTSRVGGGVPELGLMMAQYNQPELVRSLYQYRDQVDRLIQMIETSDWQSLAIHLRSAQQMRPKFLKPEEP
jgi:arogenate dehydrogenase (NADP+)